MGVTGTGTAANEAETDGEAITEGTDREGDSKGDDKNGETEGATKGAPTIPIGVAIRLGFVGSTAFTCANDGNGMITATTTARIFFTIPLNFNFFTPLWDLGSVRTQTLGLSTAHEGPIIPSPLTSRLLTPRTHLPDPRLRLYFEP